MGTTQLRKTGVNEKRLTDRMRRFVFEYLIDYNARRAASAAGYRCPEAKSTRLLKNPLIARAIGKMERQTLEKLELRREDILEQLKFNVLRDPLDLCDEDGIIVVDDLRKLPRRIRCCIDGIKCRNELDRDGRVTGQTIELKMMPKHASLELAAKIAGMLTDRQQIDQRVTIDWDRLLADNRDTPNVIEGKILNQKEQHPAINEKEEVERAVGGTDAKA
jgi:hypothetical protein